MKICLLVYMFRCLADFEHPTTLLKRTFVLPLEPPQQIDELYYTELGLEEKKSSKCRVGLDNFEGRAATKRFVLITLFHNETRPSKGKSRREKNGEERKTQMEKRRRPKEKYNIQREEE